MTMLASTWHLIWKRPTFHPPRPRTICVQPDKYWHCFEGNLGGRLLRDGAEWVWAFPSATMPSWAETETKTDIWLTLNVLVAVVNSLSTKTHSSKEVSEFCFGNADVKSICYCKQRVKSKLSHQNVSKQSSVSHARLSPHTHTVGVV